MRFRQVATAGGKGSAPDRFVRTLRGIAVDGAGRLYAAGDAEIKVFDGRARLEQRWPTASPPYAVAVAADGTVWAGEAGQIEIFAPGGRRAGAWSDAARLGRVTAIGFAPDAVLVADAKDRSIRRYRPNGAFVGDIGKDNPTRGFRIPNGVVDFAVDVDGAIHAANPGKHRIERYAVDGRLVGRIGRFDGIDPAGFPGCCNPTNLAVAGRERIYVTEKADPRVKAYDFQGNLLGVVASDVFDPGCKNMDIAVDGRGRVWVADTVRLTVLGFEEAP